MIANYDLKLEKDKFKMISLVISVLFINIKKILLIKYNPFKKVQNSEMVIYLFLSQ